MSMSRQSVLFAALFAGVIAFGGASATFAQEAEPAETQTEPQTEQTAEDSAPVEEAEAADADATEETEASEDAVADDAAAAGEAPEGEALDAEADDAVAAEEAEVELPTVRDWGRLQPAADLVDAGGPIIVILGVLSIISLAIVLLKLIQFTALRVGDHAFIDRAAKLLQKGEADKALDLVSRRGGVVARVMEAALRGLSLGGDPQQVREEVERVARVKLDGLERGLALLSLIATSSPLLGLLGTVLGMIEAFQQLENAGDRVDPAILSGGIWEALLTTAAGLSVAIPAAAFFTWLQRAVDVAGGHMENAATRVFTAGLYSDRSADASDDA